MVSITDGPGGGGSMSEHGFYVGLLVVWFVLSLVTLGALLLVPAPYGRHARGGLGPELPARSGWVLMELPALLTLPLLVALAPPAQRSLATWVFVLLWLVHYGRRTLVFPFKLSPRARPMPLAIVTLGAIFNVANGYLNGRGLTAFARDYGAGWLLDPRFLVGLALFGLGLVINARADAVLLELRRQGGGYRIPHGGLYRFVSCPNYLGEMIEWWGWALLTWSWAGLSFAVWTTANLLPRALAHHRWYRERFPDYPPERRAVIPGLL